MKNEEGKKWCQRRRPVRGRASYVVKGKPRREGSDGVAVSNAILAGVPVISKTAFIFLTHP